jgi:predicted transglutaminase-like cysteine proteinase
MIAVNCYADDLDTVTKVNRWVNHNVQYITDKENQRIADYWQTPRETLKSLKGDCEDFAILKYFMLINWGIPDTELSLWYGNTPIGAHAVTSYKNKILDNRTDELITAEHSDFIRMFELHEAKPRWADLTNRMK